MICGVDAHALIYSAVESMPEHKAVLAFFERQVLTGELVCAVSFPILWEFIHVTTDPKRFKSPRALEESLDFAGQYWNAEGWSRLLPKASTGERALAMLRQHLYDL